MKKALVTGATGFLGSWLCEALLERGYQVFALTRAGSDTSSLASLDIQFIKGDVTDRQAVFTAVEGMDEVFHLAGLIAYQADQNEAMERVNVGGTKNIVDACLSHKTQKLLYLSSVVSFGASLQAQSRNEESEYNLAGYGLGYFDSKRRAEDLVLEACKTQALPAYIVNPSTVYGRGDARKGSRRTQLKVAQGKFPFYPPGGVNVVAVEDVIAGIFLAMEKGVCGRPYILSGENLRLKDLFYEIARAAQVAPPAWPLPGPILSLLGYVGDFLQARGRSFPLQSHNALTAKLYHWFSSDRAQNELGYRFRPAREAIQQSVAWMREQNML